MNKLSKEEELELLIQQSMLDSNGELDLEDESISNSTKDESLEYPENVSDSDEESYILDDKSKLSIKDTKRFINMLSSSDSEESQNHYTVLKTYALKQMVKFDVKGIPSSDYTYIIDLAIAKALVGYSDEYNNQFLSYFYSKIQGEVSAYKAKSFASDRKLLKYANEDSGAYAYQKSMDTNENELIAIDSNHMGEQIGEEDLYIRQMRAFKMAYSGIPMELQNILHLVASGYTIKAISKLINRDDLYVSKARNQALSLILQRIMRGNHLTASEKDATLSADRKINNKASRGALYEIEVEEEGDIENEN